MSPEERTIIAQFVARVGGAGQQPAFGGSVPATQPAAPLPAVDPEADRFISDQFAAYPEARYRITQMAFVQEAAIAEAHNRIKQLEYQLGQARQQAQAGGQSGQGQSNQGQSGQSHGFFGGLFGGGSQSPQPPPQQAYQPQYAPPPQASYPPGYRPGMFGGGGSGFLGSALTTAAGVAGGMLAADAIGSMFSPHMGGGFGGGGFGGGGFGGGMGGGGEVINETTVNNYGDAGAAGGAGGDPWGGAGVADTGGNAWGGDAGGGNAGGDAGGGDAWAGGGASDAGGDSGSWDDNSGGGGGDSSF